MARVPRIIEFKYKNGVLIRSAAMSWRPGKWPLGAGAHATVANGPSNGFLVASTFLTIVTPQGEVHTIEAIGSKEAARAHKLAAEINRDAMVTA